MTGAYMTLSSGREVDLLRLTEDDVDIRDIAHHLARINRFGGATKRPVSVAQHSVYVSRIVPRECCSLQGLLHDATEAYLGDVVHWLKQSPAFDEYRRIESKLEQVIWRKYGCPLIMCSHVTRADRVMCRFEAQRVMPPIQWTESYAPITPEERERIGRWQPWSWQSAEEVFLSQARMLGIKC